jgi:putative ABC transport system permease protein
MSNFGDRATNSIQLWAGRSSMPYEGLRTGRWLTYSEREFRVLKDEIPEIGRGTPIVDRQQNIVRGSEFGTYTVRGVKPDYAVIFNPTISAGDGRFINQLDMKNQSKVVVIDKQIEEQLFRGKSALGEHIQIGSIMFRVIGINSKSSWSPTAYIPFTTAQALYNPHGKFSTMAFLIDDLKTEQENEALNDRVRAVMARTLRFNVADPRGIWIRNNQREFLQTMRIFGGINIFVSIIGIFTLIAGIVGVSNIMLVSVKERTREIGIRKAIGASPASILRSIILESVLITSIFGYIGLLLGTVVIELVNMIVSQSAGDGPAVFKNPSVEMSSALTATIILIISGVIAGYIPARRAVKIKPIEAMKE